MEVDLMTSDSADARIDNCTTLVEAQEFCYTCEWWLLFSVLCLDIVGYLQWQYSCSVLGQLILVHIQNVSLIEFSLIGNEFSSYDVTDYHKMANLY